MAVIARLNDALRRHGNGGKIMMTRAVAHLTGDDVARLLRTISDFADFDADNDPHGERDFGSVNFGGQDLLWKIDYYDARMQFASDDPADASITTRVLTIMLESDY